MEGDGVEGLRVLVVDDCPDTTATMTLLLTIWGHHVDTAHHPDEALALADGHRPDVVLLDIALPGMTGWELARKLCARPELREALFVAISGYGQDGDRQRSREAGCDLHLTKPADPTVLRQLLQHFRPRRGV